MPEKATTIQVAEAVAAELAAMGAVVELVPEYELQDIEEMRVVVVPASLGMEGNTVTAITDTVSVDIGILKRVKSSEKDREANRADIRAQVADLVRQVEALGRMFLRKRLPQMKAAMCVSAEIDPLYDPDLLRERRQFTGVVRLEFEL